MKTCNECGRVVQVAVCGRNVTLCYGCLRQLSGETPKRVTLDPPFEPWRPIGGSPQYTPCDGPIRTTSGG